MASESTILMQLGQLLSRVATLEAKVSEASESEDIFEDVPRQLGEPDTYDFDPRFEDTLIYRKAGRRCVVGGPSAFVDKVIGEGPEVTGDGTYWMRWRFTTDTTEGAWDEGYSSSPPTEDETCTVIRLWTVANGAVTYHERGSIRVIDWGDC